MDFYGDFDLAGKLPIDSASGHKLFPGYFDDLEGGPRATDDPAFRPLPEPLNMARRCISVRWGS
ncbi:hypothetical protein [Methylobacillus glycogenes]|uniref:hypothetical protein n=1 Tax=Methylobacillus glycogenes TaxID=406 RepID=UPI0011DD055E|nr:hypothetical protein [Methylobacillus glycogenes]